MEQLGIQETGYCVILVLGEQLTGVKSRQAMMIGWDGVDYSVGKKGDCGIIMEKGRRLIVLIINAFSSSKF